MVSACSWNSDSLWPSLSDSGASGNNERAAAAAANEQTPASPAQPVFSPKYRVGGGFSYNQFDVGQELADLGITGVSTRPS